MSLTGAALRDPDRWRNVGDLLAHRGPDGAGVLQSSESIIGARRLAVQDASSRADQPLTSPDRLVWLVCNGEIYNADRIRARYRNAGYPFRSVHNDVEPILPLYLEYGESVLQHIEGMFALAVWDARFGRLLLARDRAGEKPLYYVVRNGELHFASEPQVLLATGGERAVSPDGLLDFLTLGYVPAPRTVFAGIQKMAAAETLVADSASVRARRYWDPVWYATQTRATDAPSLSRCLKQAVARQLACDGPVGVFTSGGLDSSLLAVIARSARRTEPMYTYAARFASPDYDESSWALRVARLVRSQHRSVWVDDAELDRALNAVTGQVCEPVGDPAILPTWLLARAASQEVKVVLSGEGADELFGGYPTYLGQVWAGQYTALPAWFRHLVWRATGRLANSHRRVPLGFLLHRFATEAAREPRERHLAWFGALGPWAADYLRSDGASAVPALWARTEGVTDTLRRIMTFDLLTYLPDNLLAKVDRATMLFGVEARAPYLDRRVMELMLGAPRQQRVRGIRGKVLLKEVAHKWLPGDLIRRRKQGLSVPVGAWLNAGLREEVDYLLEPARLERQGWFRPALVARLVSEHRSHRANHARGLWPLVMFQRWHARWIEHPPALPVQQEASVDA